MFHSQYDYDTTIFTIDGKILQIEYAKNAAKNGQLGIGVRSSNHLVLFSNNNKNKEFVQKTNKLFSISPNTGMMVSGVIGDSKIVFQFIEKKNEQYIFMNKTNCPTPLLTSKCSAFFHRNTLHAEARPLGVSILISGYDLNGPSLFKISSDGSNTNVVGCAIGMGSKTLNGKMVLGLGDLKDFSVDELLIYSLEIYQMSNEEKKSIDLFNENIQLGLNGKGLEFCILNLKYNSYFIINLERRIKYKHLKEII
mmetsp:Transcript_40724/g.83288  ORF Transcript_40724/g.83288 Transcript_40724/m.83288 type:complete len:252 (+) Transcript_40724:1437-2192(+)